MEKKKTEPLDRLKIWVLSRHKHYQYNTTDDAISWFWKWLLELQSGRTCASFVICCIWFKNDVWNLRQDRCVQVLWSVACTSRIRTDFWKWLLELETGWTCASFVVYCKYCDANAVWAGSAETELRLDANSTGTGIRTGTSQQNTDHPWQPRGHAWCLWSCCKSLVQYNNNTRWFVSSHLARVQVSYKGL